MILASAAGAAATSVMRLIESLTALATLSAASRATALNTTLSDGAPETGHS